jgi:hypothetical protein
VLTTGSQALRTLAGLDGSPYGILSLYVTVDSAGPGADPAPWQLTLQRRLNALLHRLRAGSDPARLVAVQERLAVLAPQLSTLVEAGAPGRGRALFATVAGPEVHTGAVGTPLGSAVVLDSSAYLRPLVAAHSAGGPAGIVVVSGHGVRLVESRLGRTVELTEWPYPQPVVARHELAGPGPAGPLPGRRSAAQTDLVHRREQEHLLRFLRAAAAHVDDMRALRGWQLIVVAGTGGHVAAVIGGLPAATRAVTVPARHVAAGSLSAARVAEMVSGDIRTVRRRMHLATVRHAVDAALGGGPGAAGPAATLAALAAGRVRHLLLDPGGSWRGWRDDDGRLHAGAPPGQGSAEPDLGERMIEVAYRTGADVTLVDCQAAGPLEAAGGVAALLRW